MSFLTLKSSTCSSAAVDAMLLLAVSRALSDGLAGEWEMRAALPAPSPLLSVFGHVQSSQPSSRNYESTQYLNAKLQRIDVTRRRSQS